MHTDFTINGLRCWSKINPNSCSAETSIASDITNAKITPSKFNFVFTATKPQQMWMEFSQQRYETHCHLIATDLLQWNCTASFFIRLVYFPCLSFLFLLLFLHKLLRTTSPQNMTTLLLCNLNIDPQVNRLNTRQI